MSPNLLQTKLNKITNNNEKIPNICLLYLKACGLSLKDYWGHCGSLSSMVVSWAKHHGIIAKEIKFFRPGLDQNLELRPAKCKRNPIWDFHIAVEINNFIHDPWFPYVAPTEQYIKENFGHYNDIKLHRR